MLSSERDREREGMKLKFLHENQNISCHCLIAREFKKKIKVKEVLGSASEIPIRTKLMGSLQNT